MKKVLVIEDDAGITDLLEVILEGVGYEVIASTKPLPLDKLTKISPDLILLDHYIEDGLGIDYCKKLKATPRTQHIPVIIVSAIRKIDQLAKDACADGYLEKPFDIGELENAVAKLIK